MTRLPRLERTDGRRKGYKPHKSRIEDSIPAEVRRRLEAMRVTDRKVDR